MAIVGADNAGLSALRQIKKITDNYLLIDPGCERRNKTTENIHFRPPLASNPAMTRHYTHVSEWAAGQAVAALPALGESEKTGKETRPPENTIPELSAILPELQRMNAKNWRKIRDDLMETLNSKPVARID